MAKILTFFLLLVTATLFGQANHRDSIDVLHYNLHIDITQIPQSTIIGKAIIEFSPLLNNSNSFGFDLQKLTVDSVKLNSNTIDFQHTNNVVSFVTTQNYNVTDTLSAEIYYQGVPAKDPSGWGGFYFNSGQAFNLGVGMRVNPHVYGRCWYPCIDNFTDKATYDFYITTIPSHTATCGGVFQSVTSDANGNKVWHWKIEQPVATYITSVVVGELEKVEFSYQGLNGQIPIDIYCKPSQVSSATTAFSDVPLMLQIYENAFGPYPYPRAGYTVVNFNSGAMEHVMNIAYPNDALTTSLSGQTLMAHELSHMWFGNSVTCATAEDMWMNEGWATFCEGIFVEGRDGYEEGKKYFLDNHRYALTSAHTNDGGFIPLYGVSHENTYGTTVYKKGGDFVRSLRGYLGDSVFFAAVKLWLSENAHTSKNTYQLRDFLTEKIGTDITPFFDSWIFNSGFPHYAISNFSTDGNQATVEITQSRLGGRFTGDANKVNVSFFQSPKVYETCLVEFDGKRGTSTFNLPFNAKYAIVDYKSLLADATIKNEYMLYGQQQSFSNQSFIVYPQTTTDSAWIHVIYNFVKPEEHGQIFDGIELTPHYYWTINMESYGNFRGRARFYHTTTQNPADSVWKPEPNDRIEMLYRALPSQPWVKIDVQNYLTWMGGYAFVDSLRPGEYAFGILRNDSVSTPAQLENHKCKVFPNPAKNRVTFFVGNTNCTKIEIFSVSGLQVDKISLNNATYIEIDTNNYKEGVYIVRFMNKSALIESRKLIITK